MRTGPSLTDLNNTMILWEYERALKRGHEKLASMIVEANPQIPVMRFVVRDFFDALDKARSHQ